MVIMLMVGGWGGGGEGRVVSTCKTNNKQFLIQNHSDLEF